MNISFQKEEYWLINNAIFLNLDRIKDEKEDIDNERRKNLAKTLHLVNDREVETGKIIQVEIEDILNMTESLFYKIEEYNKLIIRNRTEGHPTDIYETNKKELVELYKKIMLIRF